MFPKSLQTYSFQKINHHQKMFPPRVPQYEVHYKYYVYSFRFPNIEIIYIVSTIHVYAPNSFPYNIIRVVNILYPRRSYV